MHVYALLEHPVMEQVTDVHVAELNEMYVFVKSTVMYPEDDNGWET